MRVFIRVGSSLPVLLDAGTRREGIWGRASKGLKYKTREQTILYIRAIATHVFLTHPWRLCEAQGTDFPAGGTAQPHPNSATFFHGKAFLQCLIIGVLCPLVLCLPVRRISAAT